MPKSDKRYARLNNNFANQGLWAAAAKQHGITGRDEYVLFAFLAEAQKLDKPQLEFRSQYEALKLLGWPPERQEYESLRSALAVWRKVGFDFKRWFRSLDFPRLGNMTREGRLREERRRKQRNYRERVFPCVWRVRTRLGGRFVVSFHPEFWKANRRKRYFCRAWPDVVRRLRYVPTIHLALLMDAYQGKLKMHVAKIAAKVGIEDAKPGRRLASIRRAVEKISEATGIPLHIRARDDGMVSIFPNPLVSGSRPQTQDEDDWKELREQARTAATG